MPCQCMSSWRAPSRRTEGIEEGGTGFVMGPHKAEVTGALGIGKSAFEEGARSHPSHHRTGGGCRPEGPGRLTDSVKDVEGLLKGLTRRRWTKLDSDGIRPPPSSRRHRHRSQRLRQALPARRRTLRRRSWRQRSRRDAEGKVQYEAARATSDFLHEDQLLRLGVTKLARRFQSLYGTKTVQSLMIRARSTKPSGSPTEDLLRGMARAWAMLAMPWRWQCCTPDSLTCNLKPR